MHFRTFDGGDSSGDSRHQPNWTWILLFLFVFSMLNYPIYEGFIGGWPLNFVLIYAILYAFYIREAES